MGALPGRALRRRWLEVTSICVTHDQIEALSTRWLFIGDGIMTALLEWWLERDIAMFAQGWTIEFLMLFYRVWHVAPFAFVVFHAGLRTVNMDTLESAIIDGASRWERLRYVVIPHLMPLIHRPVPGRFSPPRRLIPVQRHGVKWL